MRWLVTKPSTSLTEGNVTCIQKFASYLGNKNLESVQVEGFKRVSAIDASRLLSAAFCVSSRPKNPTFSHRH